MSRVISTLRRARAARGLTQQNIAEAMGTTQSAIARLEAGRISPRLETIESYATAVGQHLEARGEDVVAACAATIRDCLARQNPDGALRAVIELLDGLLRSADPSDDLRREPDTTGTPEWDAAIAAACERAARLTGVAVPGWTAAPSRFLNRFWVPVEDILGRPSPGLAVLVLASSPPEFAIRGVLIDADSLASV